MESILSGIEHIGAPLLKARLEEHLTQEQLAELSGTNQALIQKIENGHSYRPRPIMSLAEVLKVNPAWLQFGEPYA
jgi:transcriptional regulator with XRE-family HTH domain